LDHRHHLSLVHHVENDDTQQQHVLSPYPLHQTLHEQDSLYLSLLLHHHHRRLDAYDTPLRLSLLSL
jgi:hypothetical protein